MKTCVKCSKTLNEDSFSITTRKNKKTYLASYCKDCNRERIRAIQKRNRTSNVRVEFINCVINENNKKYFTSNLLENDVKELMNLGYHFIFK